MFIENPQSVKGYKLWCFKEDINKCIISRDVTFNEVEMSFCVKEQHKQQAVEHVEAEVKIDSSVTSGESKSALVSQGESSQQFGSDGGQSQQERTLIVQGAFKEESSSNNDLKNYRLTRDRHQRVRHALARYDYVDLVAYAYLCI